MKVTATFTQVPANLFQTLVALGLPPTRLAQQFRRIPIDEDLGPSHVARRNPGVKPHALTPTQESVTLIEYDLAEDAFERAHTIGDKLRELGGEVSLL